MRSSRILPPTVLHKSDLVVAYEDCNMDSAFPGHYMAMLLSSQNLAVAMDSHCVAIHSEPNLHHIPISTEVAGTSNQGNVMGALPSTLVMNEELSLWLLRGVLLEMCLVC